MEKERTMTTEEQQIYDLLTDTQKNLYRLLHLQNKDVVCQLQDVTEAVRKIQANQNKQKSFTFAVVNLVKRLFAFINSEVHKLYIDDKDV